MPDLPASSLYHATVEVFGVNPNNPYIMIISGQHGNEPKGIEGTKKLIEYLRNEDNEGVMEILAHVNVMILPGINIFGKNADARMEPPYNCTLDTRKIKLPKEYRGSINVPEGWVDPNRINPVPTSSQLMIESLATIYKPVLIILNHDWALPSGKVTFYNKKAVSKEFESKIYDVFLRVYPKHNSFGNFVKFVECFKDPDRNKYAKKLIDNFNSDVVLVENYVNHDSSPEIHFRVDLLILQDYPHIFASNNPSTDNSGDAADNNT